MTVFKFQKRKGKAKHSRHHHTTVAPPAAGAAGSGSKSQTEPRQRSTQRPSLRTKQRNATAAPALRSGEQYRPAEAEETPGYVEVPKDLYQSHLRPGVVFRVHMSEALIKMKYRNYAEHKDESVIEADVEYLRLTRKLISDEIAKFEEFRRLMGWFVNRTDLVRAHACGAHYSTRGIPNTLFTDVEENMKRNCLFDAVYLDQIPYVVGEDRSLIAAVAPPVLHCDAATCTSVPFVDSLMFEEKLPMSSVRTVTRCQAGCRARCKNDADCLKRCADRCLPPA